MPKTIIIHRRRLQYLMIENFEALSFKKNISIFLLTIISGIITL